MNVYEGADRAIKEMNRANLKNFGLLKMAKFDSLSLIRQVSQTFDQSAKLAKRKYFEIAVEAFVIALYMMGVEPEKATRMADEAVTNGWVDSVLEKADPVSQYVYTEETERKKQRLTEALTVTPNKGSTIDTALRWWTKQVAWYTIVITDEARRTAFKAAGVERLRWVTQKDGRVCMNCRDRDGRTYPIDNLPPKEHYGCRCYWVPA